MIRYLALDVQAERSLVVAMVGVEVVPECAERRGVEAGREQLERPEAARVPGPELLEAVWSLHEDGGTQLCYEDPGFEIDAYLRASVRDMIRIVRGDLPLQAALAEERLDVAGPSLARGWLPVWFNLGPLAAVRSERAEAGPSPRGTRRSVH